MRGKLRDGPRAAAKRWRRRPVSSQSAGKRRPRSPSAAAPRRASATAWRATSPSEWPCRRRRGGDARCRPGPAACPGRTDGCHARSRSVTGARAQERLPPGPGRPGRVTLRLSGSPGTTWTGMPHASSSAASSVHVSGAAGRMASIGGAKQVAPDALGRLGRAEPVRSTVSPTRSPSIRLRVSAIGTTGMAAPWRAVVSATRRTSPGGPAGGHRRGRAPAPARRRRAGRRRRSRRARTPGGERRRQPRHDLGRQPRTTTRSRRRSGAATTMTRPISGAAATAASVQASSGRPPSSRRACRCRPSGSTAGCDYDGVGLEGIPAAALGPGPGGACPLNRAAAGRRSSDRPPSGARG